MKSVCALTALLLGIAMGVDVPTTIDRRDAVMVAPK